MFMIDKIKQHKIITLIGVVLVVGAAWAVLSGGGETQSSSLLGSSLPASLDGNVTVSSADRELQETLTKVRAIELNSTIFNEPAFLNLQDIGQQIISEPVGRENPFAPISSGSGAQ